MLKMSGFECKAAAEVQEAKMLNPKIYYCLKFPIFLIYFTLVFAGNDLTSARRDVAT
jgi:hypothetical protein